MNFLVANFGGNLAEQKTLSGKQKFNWQLNADKSSVFLQAIEPHLILKKGQARLAILWQQQRPVRIRDAKGRIAMSKPRDKKLDKKVSILMKKMKYGMENARELVKIEHTLKQIINVKGD